MALHLYKPGDRVPNDGRFAVVDHDGNQVEIRDFQKNDLFPEPGNRGYWYTRAE